MKVTLAPVVALIMLAMAATASAATTATALLDGRPPTTSATVTETGFDADAAIDVHVDTTNVATSTSNAPGAVSAAIKIPASAESGTHRVTLDEERTCAAAQAPFLVSVHWSQGGFGPSKRSFQPVREHDLDRQRLPVGSGVVAAARRIRQQHADHRLRQRHLPRGRRPGHPGVHPGGQAAVVGVDPDHGCMGNDTADAFQYYARAATPGTAPPVTVTGGQTTAVIDATLATGALVWGSVTDSSGVALPGVSVPLEDTAGNPVVRQPTDAGGNDEIDQLPAGRFILQFVDDGCVARAPATPRRSWVAPRRRPRPSSSSGPGRSPAGSTRCSIRSPPAAGTGAADRPRVRSPPSR